MGFLGLRVPPAELFWACFLHSRTSQVALVVRNPPANPGDIRDKCLVWCLGREDSLEEEVATHSSILAWRIPRTEEPARLQSTGLKDITEDMIEVTYTLVCIQIRGLRGCNTDCILHSNFLRRKGSASIFFIVGRIGRVSYRGGGEGHKFGGQPTWIQVLLLPCVTLGELLNLSGPSFPLQKLEIREPHES